MKNNSLSVVAIVETSSDRANELREVCLALIEPSRADQGCISYNLYQDRSNPGKFTFLEQWESQADLDNHLNKPHLVAAVAKFEQLLIKDLEVITLDLLA